MKRVFGGMPLIICTFSLLALAFSSCEEENWNLVNPPPGGDSIAVRFINMSGDKAARIMTLDSKVSSQSVDYGNAAAAVISPADSVFFSLKTSGGSEYKIPRRIRFNKASQEIIIAVPTPLNSKNPRDIDTILQLNTQRGQFVKDGYANLRFVNVVNDSTLSYQLRVGCPNGNILGSAVSFKQRTSYSEVPAGKLVLSLLHGSEADGVFEISMAEKRFYTLLIYKDGATVKVKVLDELDNSSAALRDVLPVPAEQRTSKFRVINFSRTVVDEVRTKTGTVIASGLSGKQCGSYKDVITCTSDSLDVLQLSSGGSPRSEVSTSIGVLAQYTVVAYDSVGSGTAAAQMTIVPPLVRGKVPSDSVVVRVVNTLGNNIGIRVRLGARTVANNAFLNGEVVADATAAGAVSEARSLAPGFAPLTIVSSEQPEKLLGAFIGNLSAGKEYLFIVGLQANGKDIEVTMVESGEENVALSSLAQGVFTQVVHARADRTPFSISFAPYMNTASIGFSNSVATVLPQGTIQFGYSSLSRALHLDTARRMTLIVCGDVASPDLIAIDAASMRPVNDTARSRYINAARDVPLMRVSVDSVKDLGTGNLYLDSLEYKEISTIRNDVRPKRINLVFGNPLTLEEIYRSELSITYATGKAYSVILCGDAKNGYALILQQEY